MVTLNYFRKDKKVYRNCEEEDYNGRFWKPKNIKLNLKWITF